MPGRSTFPRHGAFGSTTDHAARWSSYYAGRGLGSADDQDFSRETHPVVRGVRTKGFERLALDFSQLLAGEHGDQFTQLFGGLAAQRPKVFQRDRRVDGEGEQASEGAMAPACAENVAQLARGGEAECIERIGVRRGRSGIAFDDLLLWSRSKDFFR